MWGNTAKIYKKMYWVHKVVRRLHCQGVDVDVVEIEE